MDDTEPRGVLDIQEIVKHYRVPRRGAFAVGYETTRAVDGVSLRVRAGETLALVGESGSGKSTTAKVALGLVKPDSGRVVVDGHDIGRVRGVQLRKVVRPKIQAVFQDPGASLNPRKTVGSILSASLRLHDIVPRGQVRGEVLGLLESVDLNPAQEFFLRYPHELSGGQQQRVAIARALAVRPEIVVADEPVSALDVSVRSQILDLLLRTQEARHIGLLMITHDLAVVRAIAPSVAVMFQGKIVEQGSTDDVFASPQHEYTKMLLESTPRADPSRSHLISLGPDRTEMVEL